MHFISHKAMSTGRRASYLRIVANFTADITTTKCLFDSVPFTQNA
jgi:hypothetical protein